MKDSSNLGNSPTGTMRKSIGCVVKDVVTLCELQVQLLQADGRDWLHRCVTPVVILGATTLVLALATLPLLLLSLAYALHEFGEMSLTWALLTAAGIGAAAAIVCGLGAWQVLKRERGTFERFRVELAQNLAWIKEVLTHPATVAANNSESRSS